MLEKPLIPDKKIIISLQQQFGLAIETLEFLPLGADPDTAVYRAVSSDGTAYFVKLRSGAFNPASVTVPRHLREQGLKEIIPLIRTLEGGLWGLLHAHRVLVYPFIDGVNGFEIPLTERQWKLYGAALRELHTTDFPPEITPEVPMETFSSHWRDTVRNFLDRIETENYTDSIAAEMAAYLRTQRERTLALVERAEELADQVSNSQIHFRLCHADIHAWNLLIDPRGRLYMVDWDTLIFAPHERDLMFIGAGLGGRGRTPDEEINFFCRGYGTVDINPAALSYYRCERIIEDIGVYCEQILLSDEGGEDRPQSLADLRSNFEPGGTIELALTPVQIDTWGKA